MLDVRLAQARWVDRTHQSESDFVRHEADRTGSAVGLELRKADCRISVGEEAAVRYHDRNLSKRDCFVLTTDPSGVFTGSGRSNWCGTAFVATASFDFSTNLRTGHQVIAVRLVLGRQ